MARVLIGWELGGNRGHAIKILAVAQTLRALGHRISFALQRVDALGADPVATGDVWQAPLTPRLLVNSDRPKAGATHSHGDTLARLGFGDPDLMAAIIRSWHRIFSAVKPDIVFADFAPFLLLAARGSIRTVALGTGFTLPPASLQSFHSLTGGQPLPEEQTLEAVNRALVETGRPTLDSLPAVYRSDENLVSTFPELDPYRKHVRRPMVSPCAPVSAPEVNARGDEIFVYAPPTVGPQAELWEGLAASGLPVRLFVPDTASQYRNALRARGFMVEEKPLPFHHIAARSRLILSTGSHGFVCSGLLAGIPQVVCPCDLEKALTAAAIGRLGVGGVAPLKSIRREPFSASLRQVYESADLPARARARAAELRERNMEPFEEAVARAVGGLL